MDIAEIRMAKINLEKRIAELLKWFEEESSTVITAVIVDSAGEKNMFLDSRHNVSVRIEL